MPTAASAKETCTIEQFQAIDIQPDTKGGVLDKESGQFLITEKPPMRCANITFTTSTTRNRIASQMNGNFEASFYDGKTGNSHSVTFNEDEVQAGCCLLGYVDGVLRSEELFEEVHEEDARREVHEDDAVGVESLERILPGHGSA